MPIPVPTNDNDVLRLISLTEHSSIQSLAKELTKAAEADGFFYLCDHGIPQDHIDRMFTQSSEFFLDSPAEDKVAGNGDMGYTAPRQEALAYYMPSSGDMKESFFYADAAWLARQGRSQELPPGLERCRADMDAFVESCNRVARRVLQGLAVALGWAPDALVKYHNGQHNRLRLLHYPAIPDSHTPADPSKPDVRAGAHTDLGCITLLFQHQVSGLQVHRNDEWLDVAPKRGCIVVNVGDSLEFWSGARLRSTRHRVVMPRSQAEKSSRFSTAYFIQPDDQTLLEPITRAALSEQEFADLIERKGLPRDTKRILAGEYKAMRVRRAQQQLTAT